MNPYFLCSFLLILTLIACKESETPQPEIHSGYILINCEVGPYYLNIDSLKANCGTNEALPAMLIKSRLDSIERSNLILSNSCVYDENPSKLGTQTDHQIKLFRPQALNQLELTSSFNSSPISLTLDGTLLNDPSTDYPFMGGYEIDLNPGTIRVYVINIWIGGCLHDMIIWELEEW